MPEDQSTLCCIICIVYTIQYTVYTIQYTVTIAKVQLQPFLPSQLHCIDTTHAAHELYQYNCIVLILRTRTCIDTTHAHMNYGVHNIITSDYYSFPVSKRITHLLNKPLLEIFSYILLKLQHNERFDFTRH